MKVLFTYDYGPEKMAMIRALGYEVTLIHESEIENNDEVNEADVLVCYNPFGKIDLGAMKKLKFIQLSSTGFDQLPKELVKKMDITVANNKGGYSKPIGEWIVMSALNIYKDYKTIMKQQEDKKWKMNTDCLELVDKKIGFIGTGSVAREGAKRFQGFEAEVIGFNTRGRRVDYFDTCYPVDQLEDRIGQLDVVVITVPYNEKTHHLLNRDLMVKMKDTAVLINVARGSIVDEKALIDILKEDKFLGVALDVFEHEPLGVDSELWDMPRVNISSHNSWISEKRNERRFIAIYENLKRFAEGETLVNVVDLERGY